jgi:hypothetical protein
MSPVNKLTPEEVEKRIQKDRPYISLDHSTFVNLSTKAKFVDSEFGEWWAEPRGILRGRGNPKRTLKKYTSYEVETLIQKDRPYISIDHSTYKNTHTKCTFVDQDFGSWSAKPNAILGGQDHPKRGKLKISLTVEEVERRIQESRPELTIDRTTFVNTVTKAKFVDSEFGEYWVIPRALLANPKKSHPKRSNPFSLLTSYEVERRIQLDRPFISIDHSTYKNTSIKCRFVDQDFGEWWKPPSAVLRGHCHPKRSGKEKWTIERLKNYLSKEKPYVTVVEKTFKGMSEPCEFVDEVYGSWFTAPSNIVAGKDCATRAGNLKRSSYDVEKEIKKDRPYISIDHSTYKNTNEKCRFIDSEYGEWWSIPQLVFGNKKTGHPKRSFAEMGKENAKPIEEIKEYLTKNFPEVSIDESTYKACGKKARFLDNKYGEYWSKPALVLKGKGSHPNRTKYIASEVNEKLKDRPFMKMDESTFVNTTTKAKFIDLQFGEYWTEPHHVLRGSCHPHRFSKYPKLEIRVSSLLGVHTFQKVPDFLKGSGINIKPDFKLTENTYLEADGLYWHSEKNIISNRHHLERRELFEKHGKRLVQFRSDEIKQKPEIIRSMVQNWTGKSETTIYSRKCKIANTVPRTFFEENHLMGYASGKAVGLEHNGQIVSSVSYKIVKKELHIIRFCNRIFHSVPGAFSKLLKEIIKREGFSGTVINFVDLRYGTGNFLKNLGFVLEKVTLGWKWTDGKNTFNRLKCRANMDERKLTERQHAEELGWYKIYDAGQAKFTKKV